MLSDPAYPVSFTKTIGPYISPPSSELTFIIKIDSNRFLSFTTRILIYVNYNSSHFIDKKVIIDRDLYLAMGALKPSIAVDELLTELVDQLQLCVRCFWL